jgi:hypothetical protein
MASQMLGQTIVKNCPRCGKSHVSDVWRSRGRTWMNCPILAVDDYYPEITTFDNRVTIPEARDDRDA